MRALANIETFLIRATYFEQTAHAVLGSLTLDTAVQYNTGGDRAESVEQCQCPAGYEGLSCESCALGYERVGDRCEISGGEHI